VRFRAPLQTGLTGMKIDEFAPRFFLLGNRMNHFMEIATKCAGRMIWAKLQKQFNPQDEIISTEGRTAKLGWSLTEQDPFNNVARTA
jgi:methylmalonyl-CoA mutase